MICPYCGKENENGAVFCENCGASLNQPGNPANQAGNLVNQGGNSRNQVENSVNPGGNPRNQIGNSRNQADDSAAGNGGTAGGYARQGSQGGSAGTNGQGMPVKSNSVWMRNVRRIAVLVVGILVLVFVLVSIGKAVASPERVVKNYMKAMIDRDWSKAYQYLDLGDSQFATEDKFAQAMANQGDEFAAYTDCKYYVDNKIAFEDGIETKLALAKFTYEDDRRSSYMTMVKSGKTLLFWDNWKISAKDKLVSNYTIYTEPSAKVTFDQVLLANGTTDSETGRMVYQVKDFFAGKHKLEVTGDSDVYEAINEDLDIYEEGSIEVPLDYTSQAKDNAYQAAITAVKAIYEAAMNESGIGEVTQYATENGTSYLEETYNDCVDHFGETDLISYDVEIFDDGTNVYESDNGDIEAEVSGQINYSYDSYWGTETNYASFTNYPEMVYRDGKWLINE